MLGAPTKKSDRVDLVGGLAVWVRARDDRQPLIGSTEMAVEQLLLKADRRSRIWGPAFVAALVAEGASYHGPDGPLDLLSRSWYYGPVLIGCTQFYAVRNLAALFQFLSQDGLLPYSVGGLYEARQRRLEDVIRQADDKPDGSPG